MYVLFEIKQSIFGIQVAFFKEIRHYFSIFFGFLREFLVALNASFTSTIEKGLLINHVYIHSFRSIIKATEKLKQ